MSSEQLQAFPPCLTSKQEPGIAEDVYLQRSDHNLAGIRFDDVGIVLQNRKHVLNRFSFDQHQAASLSERAFEQEPALIPERHEIFISRGSMLRPQFPELGNVIH